MWFLARQELGEPQKLFETRVKCPSCGHDELVVEDYLYEIPYIGKIVLSTGRCRRCGYRFNDVRAAEAKDPRLLKLRVETPDDLNVLVVRASTASIEIPELGLLMEPGPASQGFITTVEGVLERFREVLELLCREDGEECRARLEELEKAKRGEKPFTLVIRDPEGVSVIASPKVVEEPLRKTDSGS